MEPFKGRTERLVTICRLKKHLINKNFNWFADMRELLNTTLMNLAKTNTELSVVRSVANNQLEGILNYSGIK